MRYTEIHLTSGSDLNQKLTNKVIYGIRLTDFIEKSFKLEVSHLKKELWVQRADLQVFSPEL